MHDRERRRVDNVKLGVGRKRVTRLRAEIDGVGGGIDGDREADDLRQRQFRIDSDAEPRLPAGHADEADDAVARRVHGDELRAAGHVDAIYGRVDRDPEPAGPEDGRAHRHRGQVHDRERLVAGVGDVQTPAHRLEGEESGLASDDDAAHRPARRLDHRDRAAAAVRDVDTTVRRIDRDAERLVSDRP